MWNTNLTLQSLGVQGLGKGYARQSIIRGCVSRGSRSEAWRGGCEGDAARRGGDSPTAVTDRAVTCGALAVQCAVKDEKHVLETITRWMKAGEDEGGVRGEDLLTEVCVQ